jgi:biopolymer transport protein ExbB
MARISEALVATAIGIFIAIPAVAAYNGFQRIVRGTLANTDALGHLLLAHLKASPLPAGSAAAADGDEEGGAKVERSGARGSAPESERN